MKLVVIEYETVRQDNEPGPATRFNTSFCSPDVLPRPVPIPTEAPYGFSRWLPHIVRSRGLADKDVQTVKITRQQAFLIVEASTATMITSEVSRVHREDLEELVRPAFSSLSFPANNEGLFMRLEGCSPKDAKCRLRRGFEQQSQIVSAEDVVLRLVSSQRAVNDLNKSLAAGLSEIPIFFLPFNPRMGSDREYRVFCAPRSGCISAISQYKWHKPWKFNKSATNLEEMQAMADRITRGTQVLHQDIMAVLRSRDDHLDKTLLEQGFSFDAFYDEDADDIQLVELNVFGGRSGLGTCLFNWSQDFQILYGETSTGEEFRVTL